MRFGNTGHTDADTDPLGSVPHPPVKRMRTRSSIDLSVPSHATSQMSQHSLRDDDDDDDDNLPGPSKGHAQRLHDKSSGKRRALPLPRTPVVERPMVEELQQLKAELAKARADAAAAVALASEREQTGLGGSVDRLRSRA
jgi:hypothetical protein